MNNENITSNNLSSSELNHDESILCTQSKCVGDIDVSVIKCIKCRRLVHYTCTELPMYMIQQIIRSKHERYQCVNCVRITQELSQAFVSSTRKDKDIIKLNKEIKCCENIIQIQNESLSSLKAKKTEKHKKKPGRNQTVLSG